MYLVYHRAYPTEIIEVSRLIFGKAFIRVCSVWTHLLFEVCLPSKARIDFTPYFLPLQWDGVFLLDGSQLGNHGIGSKFEPLSEETCLEMQRTEIKPVVEFVPCSGFPPSLFLSAKPSSAWKKCSSGYSTDRNELSRQPFILLRNPFTLL